MAKSVLIVDDDELIRSFLHTISQEEGHRVEEAKNGREGLAKVIAGDYDLVITDLKMPALSGLELLQEGRKQKPESRWIVITAFGSIENAVEAMKAGADDYLTKPFRDPDELRRVIQRVLREAQAEQTISFLSEELGKQFPPLEMIFLEEKMQKVQRLVK